jgi:hypothetical protein
VTQEPFTFEGLAGTSKAELEKVLLGSQAPQPEKLLGCLYDGYNHDWLGQLPGKKFRKVFMKVDGANYGVNHVMEQDRDGFRGAWTPRLVEGKPLERGFFRVSYAREVPASKLAGTYARLAYFDYEVKENRGAGAIAHRIRDFVGLPNRGDYGLILGKAYVHWASWLDLFASYFILKRAGEPALT